MSLSHIKNDSRESLQNEKSGTGFEAFFRIRAEDELNLCVMVAVG
jgi:hypothetical protein